ncbi:glutamate-5-semialdehyde dehydrogenase [Peribacillus simplex]|uniref:glutamate-5-semialdehyde dehydrogenase n=1 Tax=Peribacillus simplex TaxID=1478 RepID=UPI000B65FB52|nr:glutamate-5-semialdehyde dehydrogenase [Peribacillus simplex]MDF9760857.1 glutamate-5-semialdehyde dehydrogenase [Peribacillus simplex]SNT23988.1 glutamate-5-semialdehyde dehydrogenase [Bacillus sp. OK838]
MSEVTAKGKAAKKASYQLIGLTTEKKNEALGKIAKQIVNDKDHLIKENQKDLEEGRKKGFSESILDRIMLNVNRIDDMAAAIRLLIDLKDPIGEKLETIEKENGLLIKKLRVPIGVIGMIYEARPNVTIDAATLSLKTGNAVLLRGSSSAKYSNMALISSIHKALENTEIPVEAIQLIEDTSRESAKELFHLNEYLDVLIPRGGKNLIETVIKESTVPVLETGSGNCHIFIDQTADVTMVEKIVLNGKTQRPSVCNAIEGLLIHEKWFEENGKLILEILDEKGIEVYGDEVVCSAFPRAKKATEDDWSTEYLALKISVKIVNGVSDAIEHINRYGSKHSEAILTRDEQNASIFLNKVDAAAVYHNASTRFTDGFEFGYGAEIGISTQKLHARGPMGLPALTSSKYFIYGQGQTRE